MKFSNKKQIAILQVFILVVAAFAFAWMIGGSLEVVSAADVCQINNIPGVCLNKSVDSCTTPHVCVGGHCSGPAEIQCCLDECYNKGDGEKCNGGIGQCSKKQCNSIGVSNENPSGDKIPSSTKTNTNTNGDDSSGFNSFFDSISKVGGAAQSIYKIKDG